MFIVVTNIVCFTNDIYKINKLIINYNIIVKHTCGFVIGYTNE